MNKNFDIALILFVYNRPIHTKKTLEALAKNKNIENINFYIFCDAPKNDSEITSVNQVKDIICKYNWPGKSKKIIFREKNMGLGPSVIDGVSLVMKTHDAAIVIEDDIITHESFFDYMETMLNYYKNKPSVYSISGYVIPPLSRRNIEDLYFIPRISSWGWGTWKDRWDKVDWDISDYKSFIRDGDKKNAFSQAGDDMLDMLINQVEGESESWAIRFDYNRFKHNGLTIYPGSSLVSNIGSDGSGSHRDKTSKFDVDNTQKNFLPENFNSITPSLDIQATLIYKKFYNKNYLSIIIIILRRIGLYKICVPLIKKIIGIVK